MKLLLDTHALLWFIGNDSQLSASAIQIIQNSDHEKFVSAANLWEIAVKLSLEKLKLPLAFSEIFPHQLDLNGFELAPVSCARLSCLVTLPFHHRDPFDRLLIVQALVDDMTIVTRDLGFSKYRAKTLW